MVVFGRFDVTYPDGRTETYALQGETVSVGRGATNTIALDTDTISRYHFSITYKNGIANLTDLDSANGTHINGTRLQSNQPYPLQDVQEIQIGDLRIVYHAGSDNPTMLMDTLPEITQPSEAGIRVALDMDHVDVWPASSSSIEIAITNNSATEVQCQIVADGLPSGWARINHPFLLIDPNQTTHALLKIRPARHANITPQTYQVFIRVSPQNTSQPYIEIPVTVSVKGFGGLGIAINPETLSSEDNLQVLLLNHGNEPLSLMLSGYDPTNQLNIELSPPAVHLAAGERAQVSGTIHPNKRPLLGKLTHIPFTIVVQAQTDSAYIATIPGKFKVEPSLPVWMLGTLVGLIIAIVGVLGVLLTYTAEPQITSFDMNPAEVIQGTSVELSWAATNAEKYVIRIDNETIANLERDAASTPIDTSTLNDTANVALIAVNGDKQDVETRQLTIYSPLTIQSFTADTNELIRNTNQQLIISWDIVGSTYSNIEANNLHFETNNSFQDPTGSMIITSNNANTGEYEVKLIANGGGGQSDSQSINITIKDPICTAIKPANLNEGPDSRYNPSGNVRPDDSLIAIATNESYDWIKFELSNGDPVGWGYFENYNCDGFEASQLNVIPQQLLPTIVPSPTPSPTAPPIPSPTPTPSPTPPIHPHSPPF